MSFKTLNKDVLSQVAEEFGVDWTKEDPTKAEMIKDLEEEGVTWAMYQKAFPEIEDQPDAVVEEVLPVVPKEDAASIFNETDERVLVRMLRGNSTYEVRGYTFTKQHPFIAVGRTDADFLVREVGGFRIATPDEVETFYS